MDDQNEAQEQKQLWEINDVIINSNYSGEEYEDGCVYYTLATSRADLPMEFWLDARYATQLPPQERV